jgi:hypothetical protein
MVQFTLYTSKNEILSFYNFLSIIISTKVKDPIITATNTVSATDANGSLTMPTNIE